MAKKFIAYTLVLLSFSIYHQEAYTQEINPENSFGYLKVEVRDLDSVYVAINDNFDSVLKIASGDTLSLMPGTAKVRIIKEYYLDVVRAFEIKEGEIRSIVTQLLPVRGSKPLSRRSSYPRLFWAANNFILSDPDTDLFVNGKYVGSHYARIDTVGKFEVQGVHTSGAEFTKTFNSEAGTPFHFHQKHLKPSRSNARLLSFLPGGSQLYKKQNLKAVSFSAAIIAGAALASSYEFQYQNSISEFNELNTKYKSANNAEEAFRLGSEAEVAHDRSVRLSKNRNRVLYGVGVVYLVNIVDGFIAPAIGYRDKNRSIDPFLDFDQSYRQPVIGVKSSF